MGSSTRTGADMTASRTRQTPSVAASDDEVKFAFFTHPADGVSMSCSHAHDCEASSCGEASLHGFVNHPCVTALNARDLVSAALVLRPWHERRLVDTALESTEDDPELLLHIPFTADVRLRGILVAGGSEGRAPTEMRAFVNRNDVDFGLAGELTPVQEWTLVVRHCQLHRLPS